MPLTENNQYAGGIHYATPAFSMGLYDNAAPNGGLTFDLPLATVAAFNSQALDFASQSSAARTGFLGGVIDQTQTMQAKTGGAVLSQIDKSTTLMGKINDAFVSIFKPATNPNGTDLLTPLPSVPAQQSSWLDKFLNGGSSATPAVAPAADPGGRFMYTLTSLGSAMNGGATQVMSAPPSDFLSLYANSNGGDTGA